MWQPGSVLAQGLAVEDAPLLRAGGIGHNEPMRPHAAAAYNNSQHYYPEPLRDSSSVPVLIRDESAGPHAPPRYFVAQDSVALSPRAVSIGMQSFAHHPAPMSARQSVVYEPGPVEAQYSTSRSLPAFQQSPVFIPAPNGQVRTALSLFIGPCVVHLVHI